MSDPTPQELYQRLRYELAPVAVTTVGPCCEGCGNFARGGGTCVECLAGKLQAMDPQVDWSAFVETLKASRTAIVEVEEIIYAGDED